MIELELLVIKLQHVSSISNYQGDFNVLLLYVVFLVCDKRINKFLYSITVRKYNMTAVMRNNLLEGTIFEVKYCVCVCVCV